MGGHGEPGYLLAGVLTAEHTKSSLPGLLEAVSGWPLEHPRLLVLGAFNVHADDVAFSQAKDLSMAMLGLSQLHQMGRMLDLIFGARINVDLIAADAVRWSDHLALKAQLSMSNTPFLGGDTPVATGSGGCPSLATYPPPRSHR